MAVGAENPAAVGVVEQHELPCQGMLIGGDRLAEDAEFLVCSAAGHVAEHLVESTIFLDHVDDMLDQTRLPDPFGNHPRRHPRTRRQGGGGDGCRPHAAVDAGRISLQLASIGQLHKRQRAVVLVGVETDGLALGPRPIR